MRVATEVVSFAAPDELGISPREVTKATLPSKRAASSSKSTSL